MPPPPVTLTYLPLKVVSESRVTLSISVPISVFLGLSVLVLGPMYVTDRQTDVRQHHRLMLHLLGAGHNNILINKIKFSTSNCRVSNQQ